MEGRSRDLDIVGVEEFYVEAKREKLPHLVDCWMYVYFR